ncbi:MAG: hypothetical protein B7Z37_08770 [Verrucomicrobia bacterium 12-59-8]|nr:MAG: hypothetical protein B7Z37_08770 [Verrucomicrobia bacterium 12-59-8]
MRTVVFNPVAVDDLDESTSYIGQDNPDAADEVRQDIWVTTERLDSIQPLASDLASVLRVSQGFDSFLPITFPLTFCSITNWRTKPKF